MKKKKSANTLVMQGTDCNKLSIPSEKNLFSICILKNLSYSWCGFVFASGTVYVEYDLDHICVCIWASFQKRMHKHTLSVFLRINPQPQPV